MPKQNKLSAARREILAAYFVVKQSGNKNIVQRVTLFLGRKLDVNKSNSFVRKVIDDYVYSGK